MLRYLSESCLDTVVEKQVACTFFLRISFHIMIVGYVSATQVGAICSAHNISICRHGRKAPPTTRSHAFP
jgi:hypothetical protein